MTVSRKGTMNATIAIAIVIVLGLAIAAAVFVLRGQREGPMPFEQCRPLTAREQVLYWRLRKVMPEEIVLAQVAVSRILRVKKGHNFRAWMNRVDRMTVDFVVCLPDGTIVAAVEL